MPLPTLLPNGVWTQTHIASIYEASSQSETLVAIDAFLTKDPVITVNGKKISRAEFSKELQTEKFLELTATTTFLNTVDVPANETSDQEAGSVGTSFTVTIQEAITVRDVPVSHTLKITATLNVEIEQDLSIPEPPPSIFPVFFDRRRVKELNLVILEFKVPILPTSN